VDQIAGRPEIRPCAKWTLGAVLRIGALLAALGFASVSTIDLPSLTNSPGAAQPYVPASDKWIELGGVLEPPEPASMTRPTPRAAGAGE
jgi:hypothetical protein